MSSERLCIMDDVDRKTFLKLAQQGDVRALADKLDRNPTLRYAISTTKGYNAVHFAAMAGNIKLIEFLAHNGFDLEHPSPNGVTPIQVALEYKRLNAARRIQQLRDLARKQNASSEKTARTHDSQPHGGHLAEPSSSSRAVDSRQAIEESLPSSNLTHEDSSRKSHSAPFVPDAMRQKTEKEESAPSQTHELLQTETIDDSPPANSQQNSDTTGRYVNSTHCLDVANREAAQQALAAGERAIGSGNWDKALRLLSKAETLQPDCPTIAVALAEARALYREQHPQGEGDKYVSVPHRQQKPDVSSLPPNGKQQQSSRSSSEPQTSEEYKDTTTTASTTPTNNRNAAPRSSGYLWAVLMILCHFTLRVLGMLVRPLIRASRSVYSILNSFWEKLPPLGGDFQTRESILYLVYYWKARLRWPLRLILAMFAALLAWAYPWHAYAVLVLAASVAAIVFTPVAPWSGYGIGRVKASMCAAFLCGLCALLPKISATALAGTITGGIAYGISVRAGGIAATVIAALVYYPTLCSLLMGVAAWILFLLVLPKICIFFTEFGILTYFYPFGGPFLHVLLLGGLVSYDSPGLSIPIFFFLILLYYFTRITIGVLGLVITWLCIPLLRATKQRFSTLLSRPYGSPPDVLPVRVASSEAALAAVSVAKDHYEVLNSHRSSSTQELKERYRRLSLYLHPDKNADEAAASALLRVSGAWEVLQDCRRRADYDAELDGFGLVEDDVAESEVGAGSVRVPEVNEGPPGVRKRRAKGVRK